MLNDYFRLKEHNTTVRQELIAGIIYPVIKTLAGRGREVPAGLWVLGALSLLFFVFYPY